MSEVVTQLIAEELVPGGRRLGRHIEHDPASRAFAFGSEEVTLRSVRHERKIPVLDQGFLGSCTGNAAVGALGTEPLFSSLPEDRQAGLNETEAVALYAAATRADRVPGSYPPNDTGSSGLGVCKAARAAGFISAYRWTFSLGGLLRALQSTPVLIGINWYSSFDAPAGDGRIVISDTAYVRGGHEPCLDEVDAETKQVAGFNSWGTT